VKKKMKKMKNNAVWLCLMLKAVALMQSEKGHVHNDFRLAS